MEVFGVMGFIFALAAIAQVQLLKREIRQLRSQLENDEK